MKMYIELKESKMHDLKEPIFISLLGFAPAIILKSLLLAMSVSF